MGRMWILLLILLFSCVSETEIYADAAMPPENSPPVSPPAAIPDGETKEPTYENNDWFDEIFEGFAKWMVDGIKEIYDALVVPLCNWFNQFWAAFCKWVEDWIWWVIEYNIELGLQYADWLVGAGKKMLEMILSFIPPIKIPAGFEQGLRYFVSYGSLLDKIFPVSEIIELIGLYFSIYLALIIHQYVKGWWRWIGWFHR